jgi:hypothetical protein
MPVSLAGRESREEQESAFSSEYSLGQQELRRSTIGRTRPVWARNLLFVGVCLAGSVLLGLTLAPQSERPRACDPTAWQADFRAGVERIDAAMRRSWSSRGVQPALRAPEWTIARRMSLALAGTIPSLQELRRSGAEPADQFLSTWLGELLADRRSSDYLAERLARAFVGVQEGPFLIYRRRRFVSWLADELQANHRYDEIVRKLIAEDGLWTDHPATNFITVSIKPDQKKDPDENALAARVSRALLGVRLDCAECHDHPFGPWKQSQFRALAAFFGQTQQSFTGIRDRAASMESPVAPQVESIVPAVPFHAELLPVEGGRRQRLAKWVTHPANDAFAQATANRVWAIMFGRPLVEPVDDISRDAEVPEVLKLLADDFVSHEFNLRRLLAVVASCEAFQLDSLQKTSDDRDAAAAEQAEAAWAMFPITRLRPEQVVGSLLQAASLQTIDHQSHILVRFARAVGQNEFIERYGDSGEDELLPQGGTIPQRLLMMNGKLVNDKTQDNLLGNAATQIAVLSPNDETAIETAYLCCLTRRPNAEEAAHFQARLAESGESTRRQRLEDLYWVLINSTEFSWNH